MRKWKCLEAVVQGCSRPATLVKKRLWHRCFCEIFKNTFLLKHLWWLLLNADVVTFRSTAAKILQDFQNRKVSDDIELEKMRIIKASTDIVKNEIKELDNNTTFYPKISHYQSLPHRLYCTFVTNLIDILHKFGYCGSYSEVLNF